MRFFRACALLLFLCVPPALRADVTVRYKNDLKEGSFLPSGAASQASEAQKAQFPTVTVIQIKGNKAYSSSGKFNSLLDLGKQQVTVLDNTRKLFATVYIKDFPGEIGAAMPSMPAIPPLAQTLIDSLKSNFSARKTGRTDTILGVPVEETELVVTTEMSIPADLPMPAGMFTPGEVVPVAKLVTQIWTATPDAAAAVPALREWQTHTSASRLLNPANPAAAMQQIFGKLPGFGENVTAMSDYLSKNNLPMLKSHTEMYMPFLARLTQFMQAQGQKAPVDFDANAPFMEANTEAVELSDAVLDDSIFEIPADYHSTDLPDLFKNLLPNPIAPKPPASNPQSAP